MSLSSDDEAKRLLSALQPLGNIDAMQQNVLRRLEAEPPPAPWLARRSRTAAWAGGLGLAFTAVAATAFFASSTGLEPSSAAFTQGERHVASPALPVEQPTAAPDAQPANKVRTAATPGTPEPRSAPPVAAPARTSAATGSTATAGNLIYQAATALRRDGNPRGALELLDRYARTSPSAGSSEEAQALRMEAYYRLGSPQAERLAQSYLKSFPQGRFRQSAENILSSRARTSTSPKAP